jgi:hypothetical protein
LSVLPKHCHKIALFCPPIRFQPERDFPRSGLAGRVGAQWRWGIRHLGNSTGTVRPLRRRSSGFRLQWSQFCRDFINFGPYWEGLIKAM